MTKTLNILFFIITLLAYLSVYISPATFWLAGFFSLAIPFLLIANLLLLTFYIIRRQRWAYFPFFALLFGYQYILASLSWHVANDEAPVDFSVLSYNVRVFNNYAYLQKDEKQAQAMITWLSEEDADIKCLQEFYNNDASAVFNTTAQLSKGGEYHAYVCPKVIDRAGAEFGLAIFSRFPMLQRGEVKGTDDSAQYAIFADLQTEQGTVRVYNVHLRSMSIDENRIMDIERAQENYPSVMQKLEAGFFARSHQVGFLIQHIQESPYPVLVCGDINDLPYSYSYFSLRHELHNAFEAVGNGLGFSYNGKLFFLRIDNQFYSDALEIHQFRTLRKVRFSDHFPIKGYYAVEP